MECDWRHVMHVIQWDLFIFFANEYLIQVYSLRVRGWLYTASGTSLFVTSESAQSQCCFQKSLSSNVTELEETRLNGGFGRPDPGQHHLENQNTNVS